MVCIKLLFNVCDNLILSSNIFYRSTLWREKNINSSGLVGLAKLQYLNLSDNSLMGCIPASLGALVYLQVINMDRNNITGALHNAGIEMIKFGILLCWCYLSLLQGICIHIWQISEISRT